MINLSTKEAIKAEINKQVAHVGSANKLSRELDISNATVSNILNDKSDLISDDMWRKVAAALNLKLDDQWMHADTRPYTMITEFFNESRLHAGVYALVTNPGGGKTYTLDAYKQRFQNVFYVKCERHTTERDFLKALLNSMRIKYNSHKITDLLREVVKELRKMESPVIIIDEFEKVKNDVFLLAIDLYNAGEGKFGITLIGTPYLKKRLELGVERGTLGYNELMSRIGGKVIEIPAPNHNDAAMVIRNNGISESNTLEKIITDSDNAHSEVDLRRVKRLVHATKKRGTN
jgi:DNA transposition AAA+ family ATPase